MKKKLICLFVALFLLSSVAAPAYAANYNIDFEVTSAAAMLVSLDTGEPVYEKNPDTRREPASLTKIMTYIITREAIENPDGTEVTYTQKMNDDLLGTGSSVAGLKVGNVLTVTQLLNCMMIPSGNDAAVALAEFVGEGSVQKFVDKMNQKALDLGCKNTHFVNTHGLHEENHYTTARDMSLITQYAMTLPGFMEVCSKTREIYKPVGGPDAGKSRTLNTTNMLISKNSGGSEYYQYARGVKTGSHDEAGYCLISTAAKGGQSYLCVTLGAPSVDKDGKRVSVHAERQDARHLYDWAFKDLQIKQLVAKDEAKSQIKLEYAWNKDVLLLAAEKDFSTVLPKDVAVSSVLVNVEKPESVEAPIKKGQVVGKMHLSYAGKELTTINLIATESVERSEFLKATNTVMTVLTSGWFIAIVGIIVFLVVIYIVLALIYNRKKKNLRKVKKYKKF